LLVAEASDRIVGELDRARDYVGRASENTQKIGERLKTCAKHLHENDSPGDIKGVIEQMVEETEAVGAETIALGDNLSNVAEEVRTVLEVVVGESRTLENETGMLTSHLDGTAQEIREIEREFREQRDEALTDALTGVRNRKHFDVAVQNEILSARKENQPLGLIIIDLDHFSAFNEEYGRAVGDLVLRLVARTVFDCTKGQDVVGRIGGEEFAILLPGTPEAGAIKVAENIRRAFGRKTLTNRRTGEQFGTITLSSGITSLHDGEIASQLLRRGNDAMYGAKDAGRDRIFTIS
jgi:diguanylate cyclase